MHLPSALANLNAAGPLHSTAIVDAFNATLTFTR